LTLPNDIPAAAQGISAEYIRTPGPDIEASFAAMEKSHPAKDVALSASFAEYSRGSSLVHRDTDNQTTRLDYTDVVRKSDWDRGTQTTLNTVARMSLALQCMFASPSLYRMGHASGTVRLVVDGKVQATLGALQESRAGTDASVGVQLAQSLQAQQETKGVASSLAYRYAKWPFWSLEQDSNPLPLTRREVFGSGYVR
jgi:hypothetical protein